ncbi:MAG TPA: Uma2 family endonuclease [Gemmataceae bacterium]|jgi:Uma2 family endonuclease|nr:Uma2 family endonuclease [Gemmataceae bacterium]
MSAVLTAPPAKTVTPEDLLRMPDHGQGFELVDGELKERNVSFLSSFVAGEVYGQLRDHVKSRRLGWISPEGTSFRCFPDDEGRVRRADTAFHQLDRLSPEQAQSEGHCTVVPDLVVEVISPNDLADDVNAKRLEWQEAGAKLVWVIHPLQQTIHAYHTDGTVKQFRRADILTAEPVLPEFRVPVADLFKLPSAGN